MRRIFRAQIVAVVRRIFATVVRKVVTAVVALSAANVCTDDYAIPHPQRNSLEVGIVSVSSNGRDGAHVFVSLDDWELEGAASVLRRVTLEGMLVGSANSREL